MWTDRLVPHILKATGTEPCVDRLCMTRLGIPNDAWSRPRRFRGQLMHRINHKYYQNQTFRVNETLSDAGFCRIRAARFLAGLA
jgi:hypothetical protein